MFYKNIYTMGEWDNILLGYQVAVNLPNGQII